MAKILSSVLFRNLKTKFFKTNLNIRHSNMPANGVKLIKAGDTIPSIDLYENDTSTVVNIGSFCENKKIVLLGVPGAFTPHCSKTHLPGYVDSYEELKNKGVDEIACISVNDPFVMQAWGENQRATGKVRMLADPEAKFTKAIGMELNIPKLGGIRSKRYSMVVDNKIVKQVNVEPDGTGLTCSLVTKLPL